MNPDPQNADQEPQTNSNTRIAEPWSPKLEETTQTPTSNVRGSLDQDNEPATPQIAGTSRRLLIPFPSIRGANAVPKPGVHSAPLPAGVVPSQPTPSAPTTSPSTPNIAHSPPFHTVDEAERNMENRRITTGDTTRTSIHPYEENRAQASTSSQAQASSSHSAEEPRAKRRKVTTGATAPTAGSSKQDEGASCE